MSSQLSDTSTAVDWSLDDSQFSSHTSDFSTESQSDPLKPDRLQNALSNGWAGYLSAQHTSRELVTLKQHFDEQVKQLNNSLVLMQRDLADHQQLVTTTVAETKERSEQLSSEVRQLAPLRDTLPPLQQDLRSNHEQASSAIAELSDRVGKLQGRIEGVDIIISADIHSIREQYGTALHAIESLQAELRELRTEKVAAEQKVATLESQLNAIGARQELPEGAVELLDRLLVQKDDDGLVQRLERLEEALLTSNSASNKGPIPDNREDDDMACITVNTDPAPENDSRATINNPPLQKGPVRHRRASVSSRASETKRAPPLPGSDLKTILLHYREEYKRKKPRSEVAFIWTFIESTDRALSDHIQSSLAAMSSKWVTMKPTSLRRTPSGRFISIRKGLTWKEFQRALLKMPPVPGTEHVKGAVSA